MFTNSLSAAALEKAMSAAWKKTQLITHNIANEDTPGYKAKRMEFEGMLKSELQKRTLKGSRSNAVSKQRQIESINNIQPFVYDDRSTQVRIDGNNVNIESEQIELARVQLHYQAMRDRINSSYSTLRYAITGGR